MPELAGPVLSHPFVTDGTQPLPDSLAGAVMLLGSFDGMHRGHAALAAVARGMADARGVPLAVLQCDPHPRLWFGGPSRFRIATGSAQAALLAGAGIDLVYAPRFDAAFAATPAGDFVRLLAERLRLGAVVTGRDFRFGHARSGTVSVLAAEAAAHGIAVEVVADQSDAGTRISSSAIRAAIREGRLDRAEALLGHAFTTTLRPATGGWRFSADQVLPPPGLWPVLARDARGRALGTARTTLTPDDLLLARLPAGTDRIDWLVPSARPLKDRT